MDPSWTQVAFLAFISTHSVEHHHRTSAGLFLPEAPSVPIHSCTSIHKGAAKSWQNSVCFGVHFCFAKLLITVAEGCVSGATGSLENLQQRFRKQLILKQKPCKPIFFNQLCFISRCSDMRGIAPVAGRAVGLATASIQRPLGNRDARVADWLHFGKNES
jgi:hypothetical protein